MKRIKLEYNLQESKGIKIREQKPYSLHKTDSTSGTKEEIMVLKEDSNVQVKNKRFLGDLYSPRYDIGFIR